MCHEIKHFWSVSVSYQGWQLVIEYGSFTVYTNQTFECFDYGLIYSENLVTSFDFTLK